MSVEKETIKMELSLPERFEDVVSDVQKEIMSEEISEFPPIKENDINISTAYVFDDGDEIEAKVYFRNGFPSKINFEYVPLLMINSKEEVIASKNFDLREMGDIPSGGARPWKVCFEKSCVDMDKFSLQNCKVVFDKNIRAVNYANFELESFPEALMEFKPAFNKFLEELPKLEKGNFSISTFNVSMQESGQVIVTIVMRNSGKKSVKIEQIPVSIKDENDNVIVNGKFDLNDFVINPMKARVSNLAFETNLDAELAVNSSKWKVIFE